VIRPKKPKKEYNGYGHERRALELHEAIAEFEKFKETTLKAIRKDIYSGMDAKEMRKKYASILQGRLISNALTEEDNAKAATMIKDLLDRNEGKATEKKEVSHKFSDLSDEELDAVIISEEEDLKDIQERFEN
jgi:hypothetical protein